MNIRNYNPETDYPSIKALLNAENTFGGQFDEARDTKQRLDALEVSKPGSILVAAADGKIVGTVTLFEDGRSAWLYRFAVQPENETEITKLLNENALNTMKERGHTQVLVYAPQGDQHFEDRYEELGFNKGNNFTAYWQHVV
jgi:predicted N-acetyltransferase YhbS